MRFLLSVISLFSFFASGLSVVKDCDSTSVFRPTQLALSPDPPVPGKPVRLTLVFDNTGPEITDGVVTTSASVNYIPMAPSTGPLCENTACPIVPGANDRSTETIFPSVTGLIRSKVVWKGMAGQSLLCIDTSFKVANAFNPFNLLNGLFERSLRGGSRFEETEEKERESNEG
jgi:hypothetical protein